MRRWIVRILILFLIVILFIAGAIEIILWTDLPRQWVMQRFSKRYGIEIYVDSLSTSWSGTTKTKEVTLKFPTEENAFLTIPEVILSHNAVIPMLLRRTLTFNSIKINEPILTIQRLGSGRWNVQDIISTFGKLEGDGRSRQKIWPNLDITNAEILIMDPNNQIIKVGPLNFHGKNASLLSWHFEMDIPSRLQVSGQVAQQKMRTHNLNFTIEDMNELSRLWLPDDISPIKIAGQWHGQLIEQKLSGKIKLDNLQIGAAKVQGQAAVKVNPNEIVVSAEDLLVRDEKLSQKEFKISNGSIKLQASKIQAEQLVIETAGILGRLEGLWNLKLGKGKFSGSWEEAIAKENIAHNGTFNGSLSWPKLGQRQLDLKITTQGQTTFGGWEAQTEIIGTGQRWSSSQWKVMVPNLSWQRNGNDIRFDKVIGHLAIEWPEIRLVSLNSANAGKLNAQGKFSASDKSWSIKLEAEKVQIKEAIDSDIFLKLEASGDKKGVWISDLQLMCQDTEFTLSGKIATPTAKLENVRASIQGNIGPKDNRIDDLRLPIDNRKSKIANQKSKLGQWRIDSDIEGTAWPVNLRTHSTFVANNFKKGKLTFPNLKVPLQVNLNQKRAVFETEPFELLGGTCQLEGLYELSNRFSRADLNVQSLSLKTAAEIIDFPMSCHGLINANLSLSLSGFEMNHLSASGSWWAKDLKVPPFEAEDAEGNFSLYKGLVKFEPIVFRQGQGITQAAMQFSLAEPQNLYIDVAAKKWPVTIANYDLTFSTDCKAGLNLDVMRRQAQGNGSISADVLIKENYFGQLNLKVLLEGRIIKLSDIRMTGLGGDIEGTARIVLDEWTTSDAELKWQDIELSAFSDCWPRLKGLSGKSSGQIKAKQSDEPCSLEPMRIEANIQITDGSYRNGEFGDCHIVAYAGKKRFLIEQSVFELMGGNIQTRASFSRHSKELFARVHTNFEQLDLNQLTRVFHPEANPVRGRLGGEGTIITSSNLRRLNGEGEIHLTESELINNSIIEALYNAMNLKLDQKQPKGEGLIKLQADGSKLQIPSFYYFDRGVEIRGAGTIENLNLGTASPIQGYAIGLTRPLKQLHLPGIRELDSLMTSIQTGVVTAKIRGTINKPDVTIVPLAQISGELRRLLWGQLRR